MKMRGNGSDWPSPAAWQNLLGEFAAEIIRQAHEDVRIGAHVLYKPKKRDSAVESEAVEGK